jgi:hypothetical protein
MLTFTPHRAVGHAHARHHLANLFLLSALSLFAVCLSPSEREVRRSNRTIREGRRSFTSHIPLGRLRLQHGPSRTFLVRASRQHLCSNRSLRPRRSPATTLTISPRAPTQQPPCSRRRCRTTMPSRPLRLQTTPTSRPRSGVLLIALGLRHCRRVP